MFTDKVLQKTLCLAHDTAEQIEYPAAFANRIANFIVYLGLLSNIFVSSIPDMRAISAILFHSCLAALSALISSPLGFCLPIFLVGRYTLFLSNTFQLLFRVGNTVVDKVGINFFYLPKKRLALEAVILYRMDYDLFSDEDEETASTPILSHEQYLKLEEFLKKKDNPALLPIQIAYYTGLRIGEVCGLT